MSERLDLDAIEVRSDAAAAAIDVLPVEGDQALMEAIDALVECADDVEFLVPRVRELEALYRESTRLLCESTRECGELEAAARMAAIETEERCIEEAQAAREAERERCLGIIYEASTRHLTLAPGINAWVRQVCDNIRRGIEEATP